MVQNKTGAKNKCRAINQCCAVIKQERVEQRERERERERAREGEKEDRRKGKEEKRLKGRASEGEREREREVQVCIYSRRARGDLEQAEQQGAAAFEVQISHICCSIHLQLREHAHQAH